MDNTESAHSKGSSSHPQAAPLEFRNVTKRYPGSPRPAIEDLSLAIPAGEICCIVGPSGGGKTTAMKMVNRLIDISEGDILIAGQSVRSMEVTELRRGIGYVIQQIGLFPHMTVNDNIATVPRLLGWDKARIRARSAELLELVGLEPELGKRYPAQLSGGQRQRVGLARALAVDPPLMLMDEPFGAIDPITRERLQDEFLGLQARIRKTVLFVTHDIDEAIKVGDRIIILREGGKLAQYDTPQEILAHPADEFVGRFVGTDRSLKRLSLSDLSALELLAPNGTAADAPRAGLDTSLRDALSLMLTSGTELVVLDGEGRVAGRATIDLIQAALRDGNGGARRGVRAGEEGGARALGERGAQST